MTTSNRTPRRPARRRTTTEYEYTTRYAPAPLALTIRPQPMPSVLAPERPPLPVVLLPVFVALFIVGLAMFAVPHLAAEVPGLAAPVVQSAAQTAVAELQHVAATAQAQPVDAIAQAVVNSAVTTSGGTLKGGPVSVIAPVFMPSVQYWAADIARWAAAYDLDPNLVATVMQIESCGNPGALSSAGAQGLFQVMPFHFAAGEVMTDPDTNAARGMAYLSQGLALANGNAGLAMAGYNGGHSVIGRASGNWHYETQRYYYWGTGILADISADPSTSPRLQEWLNAGGASLCRQAEAALGLTP